MLTSDKKTNRLLVVFKAGLFILLGLVFISAYGWQCGELGKQQYTLYPTSWTSGSSTGVITTVYSATLSASVNPGGLPTTVYFEWGSIYGWTTTTPTAVGSGNYNVTVTQNVTNLLANTTYYYRLAILRQGDVTPTYTENQSFTTAGQPTVTTEIATSVSSLFATLNGAVNPNGLDTTVYFQWGLSSSYGNTTAEQLIGSGTVNVYVDEDISGLLPYTTYFFRAVAVNSEGAVYGENRTFSSGPPAPVATTGQPSAVTYNSAILNGAVNPNGQDTTVYFQWDTVTTTYANTTSSQIIPAGSANVNVTANLTGLSANTAYYFRLVAYNPAGTDYGNPQSFTTLGPPPLVTTGQATSVTYNSAIANAVVNPNGLATTAYFQYGTTTAYGSTTSIQSIGSGISDVDVAGTLAGLLGSTNYNFRVVAVNASGTNYGSNQTFTTATSPPTATTNPATGVSANAAILNASVNPNGGATTVYFEYGTSPSYGTNTTPTLIGSGTSAVNVIQSLTGLTSSTTYYFTITAINGAGTAYGISRTFTTSAQLPTAITLAATDISSSGTATFNATVNPNGAATTARFQYGLNTAYGGAFSGYSSWQTIGSGRDQITVTANWTGLTPGWTIYYRVQATNAAGTVDGIQQSFTVPLPGAPTVITQPATNIGRTNAQLNGIVNPNGQTTTVYFRYRRTGTTTWYVQSPSLNIGSGTDDWAVYTNSSLVPALLPNTSYEYQVYATNSSGTTYGGIVQFTTAP